MSTSNEHRTRTADDAERAGSSRQGQGSNPGKTDPTRLGPDEDQRGEGKTDPTRLGPDEDQRGEGKTDPTSRLARDGADSGRSRTP